MFRCLRLTLVLILVAACASTPTPPSVSSPTARPSATQMGAASEPAPSEPAGSPRGTPTALEIGQHWIRAEIGEGVMADAAFGLPGWVAVGQTCPRESSCPGWGAAAWTSSDGLSWTEATVSGGTGAALTDVTWNGEAFFALGSRNASADGSEAGLDVVTWSSVDGTAWREIGSFRLDDCEDSCPVARGLAGNPDGLVIAGTATTLELAGPYRSADGVTWTRIQPSPYGSDTNQYFAVGALATPEEIFLAGACGGCPFVVARSRNGTKWSRVGSSERENLVGVSLAYDGRRIVVSGRACGGECGTKVWSTIQGQPFEEVAAMDVFQTHVTFTGTVFMLAGVSSNRIRVHVSADGLTWKELRTDLDRPPCVVGSLVSGPTGVLLVDIGCPGLWFSPAV